MTLLAARRRKIETTSAVKELSNPLSRNGRQRQTNKVGHIAQHCRCIKN